jgi:hypothetical protein
MVRVAPGRHAAAQAVRLGVSIGGGLVTLGAAATLLRLAEFAEVVDMVRGRVRKLLGT